MARRKHKSEFYGKCKKYKAIAGRISVRLFTAKRLVAHIICNIKVSSEKTPIMIRQKAEKNPAICVPMVNLLFFLLPIYHSYNPIKNGKSKKPAIMHPILKKIAPSGFILEFPRLLIQFTKGLSPSK